MKIEILQQGPPPYVVFEQRAVEDREATIKSGRLVLMDMDYVVIYKPGSKDSLEKSATDWLEHIERQARENPPKFPPDWVQAYRTRYQQWKEGQELTPMGFPIRQWAAITKAQAENLVLARVLTVEDLANANEEVLSHIGLGGRELKERARAWLESSKGNKGEELNALRVQNVDLQTQIHNQNEKIRELEAVIMSMQSSPRSKRA